MIRFCHISHGKLVPLVVFLHARVYPKENQLRVYAQLSHHGSCVTACLLRVGYTCQRNV